jgi:uncharacterized protein involved in exopolysaccharide biosynthesis
MTKQEQPPQSPPAYPSYVPPSVVYVPETPVDWDKYRRVVVGRRKLIAMVAGAGTLLATAAAFLITPDYRAEVLLAPVAEERSEGLSALAGQIGDLAGLASLGIGPAKVKTAEHVAALKSRAMTISFINDRGILPLLFSGMWDTHGKRWKDGKAPSEWETYREWDKQIRDVSLDKRSGLVTLAIEWKDPVLAAKWANDLVAHANSRLRGEAVKEAERSIAYLQRQLPQTGSIEVQQAIYRLIEAQTKKMMIASTREEYAFSVIDPAVTPEHRLGLWRATIILAGMLLSAVGAMAAAVLSERRASGTE